MKINKFKSILFPTDFSEGSINALQFAVSLAKITRAKLVLLNVVDTPFNFNIENESVDIDLITYDLITFSKSNLNRLKSKLEEKNNIMTETITYTGETIPSIVRAVNDFNSDIIIMGTKVKKDLFFKSSSFNIVKNTSIPVLTINDGSELESFKHILFPFNESFKTLKKADGVIQMAKLFNSKITLLGISEANTPEKMDAITNNMMYIKRVFDKNEIDNEVHFSAENDYSRGILNYCLQHNINLITVANNLKTAIFESGNKISAQNVINNSTMPVLTIPVS